MKNITLSNNPRLLLAKLRNGDYAHAGEEEAINLVFDRINKYTNTLMPSQAKNTPPQKFKTLDAGCGLGGTCSYVMKMGQFDVSGIDIDKTAITHAKEKYPEITFYECNILDSSKILQTKFFDLIYLFNVFYSIKNQSDCLSQLTLLAKPGAILAIFDYSYLDTSKPHNLVDLSGNSMHPIIIPQLKQQLLDNNWQVLEIFDISTQYRRWYSNFLLKLEAKREELLSEFTTEAYGKVKITFEKLLEQLGQEVIGGTIVYARYNGM